MLNKYDNIYGLTAQKIYEAQHTNHCYERACREKPWKFNASQNISQLFGC